MIPIMVGFPVVMFPVLVVMLIMMLAFMDRNAAAGGEGNSHNGEEEKHGGKHPPKAGDGETMTQWKDLLTRVLHGFSISKRWAPQQKG